MWVEEVCSSKEISESCACGTVAIAVRRLWANCICACVGVARQCLRRLWQGAAKRQKEGIGIRVGVGVRANFERLIGWFFF